MFSAHLVIFLDNANTITDAGVFSEPSPSCPIGLRAVCIVTFHGLTFREASEELRAWIRANQHILTPTIPVRTE